MAVSEILFPELDTPALLIEKQIFEQNLAEMQEFANQSGVLLRPHIKTHKSIRLAQLQMKQGACGIAVAKLSEAEVMLAGGMTDIQIANQVVGQKKIRRLLELSESAKLSCAIDSLSNAAELSRAFSTSGRCLNLLIEVDTGLHRCGLSDPGKIRELYAKVAELPGVKVIGIMTHAGHAYGAKDVGTVQQIGEDEGRQMVRIAEGLRETGAKIEVVSVGSTPTARVAAKVAGVTELRVGNYIFNDQIQVALETVPESRCALSVLTTVISVGDDGRVVTDAGSKALTAETGAHGNSLVRGYGRVMGRSGIVVRLSEEHGVIEMAGAPVRIGERFRIIPNHACAVMNLFDAAQVVDHGELVERIAIEARGCSQ